MMDFDDIRPWVVRCVRCGTCKYTNETYLPSCPAGERFRFEPFYASGKNFIARGIIEGALKFSDPGVVEAIYSCPTCGNCQNQCPLPHHEHLVDIYEAMRARAVEEGAGPLPAHKPLLASLRQYDNPWMQPRASKVRWAKELGIKDISKEKARVLYFVGCTAALDPTLRNIPTATATLLKSAGVDFGILGEAEICCASTTLRIGDRKLFKNLAERNIELLNRIKVETIVTSCAGCFKTLKHDYKSIGKIKPQILHSSEFIYRLFLGGKLKFKKEANQVVTYHDPCHLGRLGGVFDPPRRILRYLPGITFREMDRIRENAYCCGAGGGVRTAFPDWATDNVGTRIEEAEKTGARLLVSTCPFCAQNFMTGIEKKGSSLEYVDLVDLLNRLIRE